MNFFGDSIKNFEYKNKNIFKINRILFFVLLCGVVLSFGGCGKDKKVEEASGPKTTVEGDETIYLAEGKGRDVPDEPFIMACGDVSDVVNPFGELTKADRRILRLTQANLVTFDRNNSLVKWAAEGEKISYNGKEYSYKGIANVNVEYDADLSQTTYTFTIDDNVYFSDGDAVNADDLIFSLYAFCDSSYEGFYDLKGVNIKGLKSYLSGVSEDISGIDKEGKKGVKIVTDGYNAEDIHSFNIPVCPLHYYGENKKFNLSDKTFGFEKGDISSLLEKSGLVGAGPYKFIKNDKGVIYFEANEKYYKGCPATAFVQMKKKSSDDNSQTFTDFFAGVYDYVAFSNGKDVVDYLNGATRNDEFDKSGFYNTYTDGDTYQMICMNAVNLSVNGRPDTNKSKALRKAFATVFASNRADICERYYGYSVSVIDYPFASVSWAVPDKETDDYKEAYATDNKGDRLYTSDMEYEERLEKALEIAKIYFCAAGYKLEDSKLVGDKELKKMKYEIVIPSETDDNACMYSYLSDIRNSLSDIGIDLKVKYEKTKKLQKKVNKHKLQMWCQEFETNPDASLRELYYGNYSFENNILGIADSNLDELIDSADSIVSYTKRAKNYNKCFDRIFEWGVVVPIFQRKEGAIYKSNHVNAKTLPNEMTSYYGLMDEIEKLEMI